MKPTRTEMRVMSFRLLTKAVWIVSLMWLVIEMFVYVVKGTNISQTAILIVGLTTLLQFILHYWLVYLFRKKREWRKKKSS